MSESESSTPDQPQDDLLDLSSLRMMPAWVADFGKEEKIIERFAGREDRPQRGDRRGGGGFGERRPGGGGGGGGERRFGSGGPGPRRDGPGGPPRGDRRDGPPRGDRRDGPGAGPRRFGDRGPRRDGGDNRPQREWVPIPQDIQVTIYPQDETLDTLAQHVRNTGHAFSMFDAARIVLAGGERFHVRYQCADTRPAPLFKSMIDGGLFLTRDEAVSHVLHSPAIEEYYRAEDIELEAPKGDFKSVAICGMCGEFLGPPSHHSYQTSLIRLHRERFANMPFEDFKRRVRVDSTPEAVEKWKAQASKGRRWVYLKGEVAEGAEPQTFSTRAEMETHFRRTHAADSVVELRDVNVPGNIDKGKLTHVLFILLRNAVENARKHLFDISQKLAAGLERRGLKMFKRRGGKMFVSRVRPRAVDPSVVFSAPLAKLVELLKQNSGGMHLHALVEAIAPSPPRDEDAPPLAPGETPKPTQQQIEVLKDIRWLTNEGYVIEYSDGMIFLGVQGEPQPAKKDEAAAPKAEKAGKPAKEPKPRRARVPVIEVLEDVFE
ncbi:MAG: hypothetical protein HS117_04535 [Verrucomicrobiaceae bacterium]|nr:hypothetical protein [Verrucomicrobiaceae bacterium]